MLSTLLMVGVAAVMAFVLSLLVLGNPLLGLAAAAVIVIGFRAYLMSCVNKRSGLLEKQLVDALDLGARSLRAGHPLSGAFRLIADEIEAPIGNLFAEVVEQESLGVSVQEALRQVADRSRSPDMRIFAASVIIQLRSGGNLADMMERVTWVIRERMRLSRRARVLTAEAQLSKWVLLALPLGLFVLLNVMRPEYMELFFTNFWGQVMAVAAAISMLIGGWMMSRMAKLNY
jgi:tight adherence protein B